jgi:hypothetical protein
MINREEAQVAKILDTVIQVAKQEIADVASPEYRVQVMVLVFSNNQLHCGGHGCIGCGANAMSEWIGKAYMANQLKHNDDGSFHNEPAEGMDVTNGRVNES